MMGAPARAADLPYSAPVAHGVEELERPYTGEGRYFAAGGGLAAAMALRRSPVNEPFASVSPGADAVRPALPVRASSRSPVPRAASAGADGLPPPARPGGALVVAEGGGFTGGLVRPLASRASLYSTSPQAAFVAPAPLPVPNVRSSALPPLPGSGGGGGGGGAGAVRR